MNTHGALEQREIMTNLVAAPDLRLTEDGPVLVGGRCTSCGSVVFPRQTPCARCAGTGIEEHVLATSGTLWTWTVQGFRPKTPYDGPEEFTPYGVGYVDLGGEVLVEGRLTVADPARLAIGMCVELVTETYALDDAGTPCVTFAFAPKERPAMSGVSIVGDRHAPLRPHRGSQSGRTRASTPSSEALADAGIGWSDVQFAAGGSDAAGNPDTMVSRLGLTGVPFVNVSNGCATGGSALDRGRRDDRERPGRHRPWPSGSTSTRAGAFNADPADWGLPQWYGETGLMLTTQFFAMKIQRYLHDHGIDQSMLAKVAAKAFANGALERRTRGGARR